METIDGLFDGSDAHRIGEDVMREQFEAWIKRESPLACFDIGQGGDYIVLCMQDRFEAFCAGAILMGSNASVSGAEPQAERPTRRES